MTYLGILAASSNRWESVYTRGRLARGTIAGPVREGMGWAWPIRWRKGRARPTGVCAEEMRFADVSQSDCGKCKWGRGLTAGGHCGPAQRGQKHALQPAHPQPALDCGQIGRAHV